MSFEYSEAKLLEACRVLFPEEFIHIGFLRQVEMDGVKGAYRKLVKRCHPDRCTPDQDPLRMAEVFHKVDRAYKLLSLYLPKRQRIPSKGAGRPAPSATSTHASWFWQRPGQQEWQSTKPPKPTPGPGDVFYQGEMPTFKLRIGLYLYYRGLVPYSVVVDAMIWQRNMRPPIGELAVAWGWLQPREVSFIRSANEITAPFGERAVQMGLLTRSQVSVLLLQQNTRQQRLGKYFVAKGYCTEIELNTHLRELAKFNANVPRRK